MSRQKRQSMESDKAEILRVVGTEEMPLDLTIRESQITIQRRGNQKLDFPDL